MEEFKILGKNFYKIEINSLFPYSKNPREQDNIEDVFKTFCKFSRKDYHNLIESEFSPT